MAEILGVIRSKSKLSSSHSSRSLMKQCFHRATIFLCGRNGNSFHFNSNTLKNIWPEVKFFERLDNLLARPEIEGADVVEVYYLCLLLGFKGKYNFYLLEEQFKRRSQTCRIPAPRR